MIGEPRLSVDVVDYSSVTRYLCDVLFSQANPLSSLSSSHTYHKVRPHTARMTSEFMERNKIKRERELSIRYYSPDLTLFNFYLFGYVK